MREIIRRLSLWIQEGQQRIFNLNNEIKSLRRQIISKESELSDIENSVEALKKVVRLIEESLDEKDKS